MRSGLLEFGLFLLAVWLVVYICRACEAHERVMRVLEGQPGREIIALWRECRFREDLARINAELDEERSVSRAGQ